MANIDAVAIGNMALANIGQPPIQSFDEKNASGRALKLRYDECRREALSATLWNFASLWEAGVPLAIDPKPGWSYVWSYPADALRVFEVYQPDKTAPPIPFEVTDRPGSQSGRIIHTNDPAPVFIYSRDKTDPTTFDADFVNALAWLVASKIAMPITKNVKIRQDCETMWQGLAAKARSRTLNEGAVDGDQLSTYQRVR
jgi:hypothetical protein